MQNDQPIITHNADALAEYISKYICRYENIPENTIRKWTRHLLKGSGIVIGIMAGVPWIKPAMQAAGDIRWWGYVNSVCVVLSYGMTSTWIFLELTKKLNPVPPETGHILKKGKVIINITEHFLCHFFGLTMAIPVSYIASVYNQSNPLNFFLATFVAYAFNTFGLYKLNEFTIKLVIDKYMSKQSTLFATKKELFNLLAIEIPSYYSKHTNEKTFHQNLIDNSKNSGNIVYTDNHFFYKEIQNLLQKMSALQINFISPQNYRHGLPRKLFSGSMMSLNSISGAIVTIAITYNAMNLLLGFVSMSPIAYGLLMAASMFLIVLPSFGLSLFSINQLSNFLFDSFYYLFTNKDKSSSVSYSDVSVVLLSCILSTISGYSNFYVIKKAIEASPLEATALFLGLNMWLYESTIEGIGVMSILNIFRDTYKNYRYSTNNYLNNYLERLTNLAKTILHAQDEIIVNYKNTYMINRNLMLEEHPPEDKIDSISLTTLDAHSLECQEKESHISLLPYFSIFQNANQPPAPEKSYKKCAVNRCGIL